MSGGSPGGREVVVTFDDLPAVSVTRGDVASHRAITARLLAGVAAHGVPAVGFVNEEKLLTGGVTDPARVELLRRWLEAGLELGNHTFGHLDLHATAPGRYEDDIVRGEPVIRGLLRERGLALRWFRHPYLRTGTDLGVRRRLEGFLAGRGCRVAPVTIYTEDYLFAAAYDRARARGDERTARRVGDAYVLHVAGQFEYYEDLSRRLLGHELPQILLLHANAINAERFAEMARGWTARGYRFVTLEHALAHEAYASPDDYTRPEGISWLQRWALTRGHGEDFLDGEPVTPRFVRVGSGVGREGRLVRWWTRLHLALAARRGPAPAPSASA